MVKFVDEQSETDRLRAVNAELLEACKGLVKANENWNSDVQKIIGRHPEWCDSYLDAARAAIAKATNQEAGR